MEYYFYLLVLPRTLRIDRGTETDVMAAIHCFMRSKQGDLDNPTDSVLYGPSTQNKIERWWRELHERMEKFFKSQLRSLVEGGHYDSSDQTDRYAFNNPCMIAPFSQKPENEHYE